MGTYTRMKYTRNDGLNHEGPVMDGDYEELEDRETVVTSGLKTILGQQKDWIRAPRGRSQNWTALRKSLGRSFIPISKTIGLTRWKNWPV